MPLLLIDDPDYVLIDLPGAGAARVFGAIGGNLAGRSFGALPREWRNRPVIAVVRNPAARFAAICQASQAQALFAPVGDGAIGLAAMAPQQLLGLLADWPAPTGFDAQSPDQRLMQALLPQTHPFQGLAEATHILHAETLADDLPALAESLGLPAPDAIDDLPPQDQSDGSALLRMGLRVAYADDFTGLGYNSKGDVRGRAVPPMRSSGSIEELWPAYFSGDKQAPPLPDPECDLTPFATSWIETPYRPNVAKWKRNLIQHFKELEPEFGGRMRLSHLLGCTIPLLRRNPQDRHAQRLFYRICTEYGGAVARDIDLRWLISVCDTLADIGTDDSQRVTGLLGSAMGNLAKLQETERRMFIPPGLWPPQVRFSSGGRLFDGMLAFFPSGGDMLHNFLARAERSLPSGPWAGFTREILARLLANDTVLARMQSLHGKSPLDVLSPDRKAEIEMLMRQLPG